MIPKVRLLSSLRMSGAMGSVTNDGCERSLDRLRDHSAMCDVFAILLFA